MHIIQGHETKRQIFSIFVQAFYDDGEILIMSPRLIGEILEKPAQLKQSLNELVFEGFLMCLRDDAGGKVYSLSLPSMFWITSLSPEPHELGLKVLAKLGIERNVEPK